MPTRFNSKSKPKFNVPGLNSGYDKISTSNDFTIPSVGIEDADAALFNLFDKEIQFHVSNSDKNREDIKRVPVIFAAAEKWALSKRQKGIRDVNGSLILPLITVIRTSVQQDATEDLVGRGINQQTGEIFIKRRLDKSDRNYQNLINKFLLTGQSNVAIKNSGTYESLSTDRQIGSLQNDPTVLDGGLLANNNNKNIFETLVVPAPQFYTAIYEVTFWAQYTVQMFQLIETLISSFLPQGNSWRLDTPKGYWFVAKVDGNTYTADSNIENMSQEERIIKYKFTVKVPAYILATSVPGVPVPIKRYVSVPDVSFDLGPTEKFEQTGVVDPFLGSDDPTLPLNLKSDLSEGDKLSIYPPKSMINVEHPTMTSPRNVNHPVYKKFLTVDKNGEKAVKYARILTRNRYTGETVYSSDVDLGELSLVITDE